MFWEFPATPSAPAIQRMRAAFTLVELLVVLLCIGLLIGLLIPATRGSREAARRMHCSNQLKLLSMACLSYESNFNCFPAAMGGTDDCDSPEQCNAGRLSGLVVLLPYLEHKTMWDEIRQARNVAGVEYPPLGPAPWIKEYPDWTKRLGMFRCPSASDPTDTPYGTTNYVFCIGDMARDIHQPQVARGAFASQLYPRIKLFGDGTSDTIALSEVGTANGLLIAGQYAVDASEKMLDQPSGTIALRDPKRANYFVKGTALSELGRGGCWADGAAGVAMFNTILPPNSAGCAVGGKIAVDGLYPPSGEHSGGVNVAMADGSLRFISDSIDTAGSTQPALTQAEMSGESVPSPYGVWGALGTASGREIGNIHKMN